MNLRTYANEELVNLSVIQLCQELMKADYQLQRNYFQRKQPHENLITKFEEFYKFTIFSSFKKSVDSSLISKIAQNAFENLLK